LALADKIQADKSADQVKNESESKSKSKESVDKAKTRSVMQKKSTFVGVAALMFLGITFPAAVLFDDVIRESIESASIRVEAFFNDQPMNASAALVADTIEINAVNEETPVAIVPQEEVILDETVLGAIEVIAPVEAIIPENRAPELVVNAEVLPQISVPELSVQEVKAEEKIVEAKYFLQEAAFLNKNAAVAWIAKRDALEQFRVELKKNNYWAVVRGPYGEAELGRMRSNGGFENTYMISESDLLN
jgi:hypothetical protein